MKTSELSGKALDWAVAKCEGVLFPRSIPKYSTDWSQGGPIIEREKITLNWRGLWAARMLDGVWIEAETPLIAAMRCYCCAILGDEIEIPEELL